jgi:hypothetical protein
MDGMQEQAIPTDISMLDHFAEFTTSQVMLALLLSV